MFVKILIKFPTKGRPIKFLDTLSKFLDYAYDKKNISFLFSLDVDDYINFDIIFENLNNNFKATFCFGQSKTKIDAINRNINLMKDFDIILLACDDTIPIVKNYDLIIINYMKKYFPDTDGVLFFNDGYQMKNLNTHACMGKKYFERFNYIYYPGYKSVFCDNEFTEVGYILQKQIYIDTVIIRHEHPDFGFGNHDYVHSMNNEHIAHDQNLYFSRKQNNFDLSI